MAFEKQFEEHKTIKVFDKIGRPSDFMPVNEIPDNAIEEAWKELRHYMNEYGIDLDVCSPNISARELYRFTTEELFEHETDDMTLPGWSTNFIYDEFYPDPIYENSRLVEQDLFDDIFRKTDLFSEIYYAEGGFIFNGKEYDGFKAFSGKINQFKSLFDEIEMKEYDVANCSVRETECYIEGNYKATAKIGINETVFAGNFTVKSVMGEWGYWNMKEIQINGFNPE